jgi:hypothetical protein
MLCGLPSRVIALHETEPRRRCPGRLRAKSSPAVPASGGWMSPRTEYGRLELAGTASRLPRSNLLSASWLRRLGNYQFVAVVRCSQRHDALGAPRSAGGQGLFVDGTTSTSTVSIESGPKATTNRSLPT